MNFLQCTPSWGYRAPLPRESTPSPPVVRCAAPYPTPRRQSARSLHLLVDRRRLKPLLARPDPGTARRCPRSYRRPCHTGAAAPAGSCRAAGVRRFRREARSRASYDPPRACRAPAAAASPRPAASTHWHWERAPRCAA
ncbi:hypothetical protein NN561_006684 [Cricetulus griseus]